MNDTEKQERINKLTDQTIVKLNQEQKLILDQFRKVTDTVIKAKPDGERRDMVEAMAPIVEMAKLYKAINSYTSTLKGIQSGLADFPPLKIVATLMGIKATDLINLISDNEDFIHKKIKEIFGELESSVEEETSENRENEGEEEEKEADGYDVLITFKKDKEGRVFLDDLIEDETEDKVFILKRDSDSEFLQPYVGLKCVDEKGNVGYKCTRWKPAKFGDISIIGTEHYEDEEEDDQN